MIYYMEPLQRTTMKCEKTIKDFLELDAYQRLTLPITLHILFCPKCKIEIIRIQKLLESLHNASPFEMKEDLSQKIMDEIQASEMTFHQQTSSLWYWMLACVIILFSILLMPFSEDLFWLQSYFGNTLAIPLHLIMGLLLSAYIGVFIAINIHKIKQITCYQEKWHILPSLIFLLCASYRSW